VRAALQKLDEAGHVAYVVGGSVRDFLLERESKDHDIATSAGPDELCSIFPDAITVGKQFGVLKIPVPGEDGKFLEIATFRQDLEYRDHRHPTKVVFTGPVEDAMRRDLSINALYYDPKTSRILDPVEGVADLRNKIVRAIGDPSERFREDALRLLRVVRFATQFGFTVEAETEKAVRARARLVSKVSGERIRDELTLMLTGPKPGQAVRMLLEFGLLHFVLPDVEGMKGIEQSALYHPEGDVWMHTLKVLENLMKQNSKRSLTLAWAALLHDVGKPVAYRRSGGRNFNGHEKDSARMAQGICDKLKMSRAEIDVIVYLVENHLKFKDVFQMRESTLQRFIREPAFGELLALHMADATASDGNLAYYEFCLSRLEEAANKPAKAKLLTGEDLIQLGLKPGPQFSEILMAIEDLVLEDKLRTKEEALEYVVKHFVN
jgi:tRNA nucleotidyltransferase/poly(A) polymerase